MINTKLFLREVPKLGNKDFRLLKDKVNERIYSKKVSFYLETPYHKLKCPYCNSSHKIRWGKRNDMQRYKCKSCKKTYNSLTQTPLARLRRKGHWLDYSKCLKEGLTIREAALKCEVHSTTSFRWRHRFLENSKCIKTNQLAGIIDIKEMSFKESFKGTKKITKKKRRNITIIQAMDRNSNNFDLTNKQLKIKVLNSTIQKIIKEGSILLAEKDSVYKSFCNNNNIKFKQHLENLKSKTNSYKIYNLRNYCLTLEDWILNHFRGVATKYLENYVSWFRGLNEFANEINPLTLLLRAKSIEKYKHQPLTQTDTIFKL